LTWREGAAETTISGSLVNIGGEGASLVSDALPPPDVALWLQLDLGECPVGRVAPVECRLVGSAVGPSGMAVAHIRFVVPCPIELFDLTVNRGE
jgi:hypothetical protein